MKRSLFPRSLIALTACFIVLNILGLQPVQALPAFLKANDPESIINIRAAPTTSSDVVYRDRLDGADVESLRTATGTDGHTWHYVQLKETAITGWVRGDLIQRLVADDVQPAWNLCNQRDLVTMIALTTAEYYVAICKDGSNSDYYYAGQRRTNSSQNIFLPVVDKNNPYMGANPWLLKARSGTYTYQVAEFNPLSNNAYVSISVFENGNRIYHRITDSYFGSDE